MKETHKLQFLRFANFDEESNNVVNKAIKYAMNENCGRVTIVHLFLALIEKSKTGQNILNNLNITFDMMYESYQILASDGEYGMLDDDNVQQLYIPDNFTEDIFNIIGKVTAKRAAQGMRVTPDSMFEGLLECDSEELDRFLEYIGINKKDLVDSKSNDFEIPDFIADFVVDMNTQDKIKTEKVIGVDEYIDEITEVLSRKLKANPCLVGEAGVGKTTIVKGFVQRIINGNVPDDLKDVHVCSINGSLLTAGTRFRGDFEERMKFIIDWASNNKVVLFLDEIHTFINAGGGSNSSETAGNMIKQSLSDGDIRIIGATTIKEFHKFIEADSAFLRRLQEVNVKEPSEDDSIAIITGSISDYEKFHNIKVDKNIIKLAVSLSTRYMKDKYLPDKAYTILDQACTRAKLNSKKSVTENDILNVVSKITGINVNKLDKSESKKLLSLEDIISKNLIGQKDAVSTVCRAIRRSKAGIREENKPLASFLFVGPTGVGKTELCKVLSNEIGLGNQSFIKVDMSEYSEKYSISKMIGSAPGYVGYGEGGQLTEKVKHNPYSVVLFDEIEKAHPEVYNIFLQLLDEGKLTDSEGRTVDFTNCIIVMTSNAGYGAEILGKGKIGFSGGSINKSTEEVDKIVLNALKETFKPEFLNRVDNVVVFDKLNKEEITEITKLLLDKLSARVYKNNNINVVFDNSVVEFVADTAYSEEYGARNIKREIQNSIEYVLADKILASEFKKGTTIDVSYDNKIVLKEKE